MPPLAGGAFPYSFFAMQSPSSFSDKNLAVFGSEGAFWQNVGSRIESLFRSAIHVDPQLPCSPSAAEAAAQADVLFFSVPDAVFPKIVAEISTTVQLQGRIILENLSTKFPDALQAASAAGAEVCSMHTMVKTSSDHTSHTMIIMPFEGANTAQQVAVRIAELLHMNTEFLSIEQHEYVNVLQALTRLCAHVQAGAFLSLQQSGLSLEQLQRIAPASHDLSTIGRDRILLDPPVSANFVNHSGDAIQLFREVLDTIDAVRSGAPEQLVDLFREHATSLGMGDDASRTQVLERTNRILRIMRDT